MVELELLGANGDTVVMTDANGERYSIVIDDALRAAVRRDRAAVLPKPTPETTDAPVRPRQLQALMRAGATAAEVAVATGMDVAHVRRYEGPVVAERQWAVTQAQACRIGWEKDSPLLGDLVVDRLATRGVNPSSLEWDAVREGRDPWLIMVTFIQSAEEKQARWTLDLTARSVHALDDEARWLTEAAAASRRPAVFDQDSHAPGASARTGSGLPAAPSSVSVAAGGPGAGGVGSASSADPASSAAGASPQPGQHPVPSAPLPPSWDDRGAQDDTEALLADLASNRGRRIEVEIPVEDMADLSDMTDDVLEDRGAPGPDHAASPAGQGTDTQTSGIRAQVYSMSERRRRGPAPVGSRLAPVPEPGSPTSPTPAIGLPADASEQATEPVPEVTGPARVQDAAGENQVAEPPSLPAPRPRRRSRRSVPSWDEIVFGAKPE